MKGKMALSFISGAIVGSIVTYIFTKNREQYEIIELKGNEIKEELKEVIEEHKETASYIDDKRKSDANRSKPDIAEYSTNKKFTNYEEFYRAPEEEPKLGDDDVKDAVMEKDEDYFVEENIFDKVHEGDIYYPEIEEITVDQYDEECEEYGKLTLTLYKDGTLADERYQIIEDIDYKIGMDRIKEFYDSEEFELYVRNNDLEVDYEILKDDRTYFEMTGVEGSGIMDL